MTGDAACPVQDGCHAQAVAAGRTDMPRLPEACPEQEGNDRMC